ncbi:MAG: prepilin peptidase [Rhodospirillaceae bacterium]|nr:prepilin peptidase [Rhodospirillaceae bacterium]
MSVIHNLAFIAFIIIILMAARSDARTLRIPNWMSLFLLVNFLIAGVASGMPMEDFLLNLGIGALALAAGFILFSLRWFGGGDAKLYAAIALWMGWPLAAHYSIAVMLLGGAVALLAVLLRKGIGLWPDWVIRLAPRMFEKDKAVPYGLAIVAGAIAVMPRMALLPEGWLDALRVVLVFN